MLASRIPFPPVARPTDRACRPAIKVRLRLTFPYAARSGALDDPGNRQDLEPDAADERGRGYTIGAHRFAAPSLAAGLYVTATPIGNLRDVTLRALEVLAGADRIACEDTRQTARLLDRYAIATPRTSYNEHNASTRGPALLEIVADGGAVALVSDAGTPLVCDPGARLVAEAVARGLPVHPLPGASAPVAALVASGLGGQAFAFLGFLPTKEGARRDALEAYVGRPETLVLFEAPHRLVASLKSMSEVLGADRRACVSREVTKMHETHHRGALGELVVEFGAMERVRGEIAVTIEGAEPAGDALDAERVLRALLAEHGAGRAAAEAAKLTGRSRKELYALALSMKGERSAGGDG